MENKVIMFYDGGCPLCSREVGHYRRLDRDHSVDWLDISTPGVRLDDFDLNRADAMSRLHVLDREGEMQTGAAAFVALWSVLPYYGWLARGIRALGLVPLLDRLYEPFARWRLARRRDTCSV